MASQSPVGLADSRDEAGNRPSEAAKRGDPKKLAKRTHWVLEDKIHRWERDGHARREALAEAERMLEEHGRKAPELALQVAKWEARWGQEFHPDLKVKLGVEIPDMRPKPVEPEPEPPPAEPEVKEEPPEEVKRAVETMKKPGKKRGRPRKHPIRESQKWKNTPVEKV